MGALSSSTTVFRNILSDWSKEAQLDASFKVINELKIMRQIYDYNKSIFVHSLILFSLVTNNSTPLFYFYMNDL